MWSRGEKIFLYICLGIWGIGQIFLMLVKTGLLYEV